MNFKTVTRDMLLGSTLAIVILAMLGVANSGGFITWSIFFSLHVFALLRKETE